MHDGVVALAFAVVVPEDFGRVGYGENFGEVIHAPRELIGQFVERDVAKQVAQDADGVRDIVECDPPIEAIAGSGAGGEQAVGDGLRE